jgi:glycosyltransferase involved in cell wall biosynthesis
LYVGSRSGYKNFELLRRALAAGDLNDFRLVLVGGEQLLDAERREIAGRLGATDRVVHIAAPPDDFLMRLYDQAAALVITSRCEGFGLPLLEAMARGCPVACATGGSSEELVEGFAAMFDPDSPAECADAIRRATTTTQVARRSAQMHARRYDWSRSAEAHVAAYHAAAAASVRRRRLRLH